MYKLIRRISSSFFPRPDRPWPEDGEDPLLRVERASDACISPPDFSDVLCTADRPQTPPQLDRA